MDNYSVITENLTRRFGSFTAVDKVNLQIKAGEVFGFLGANGAGKTTVIRMLCCLLNPTEGKATVAGYDIVKNPNQVRLQIGYMSQKFSLYNDLTINQNIEFYGGIYGLSRKEILKKKEALLDQFELSSFATRMTGDLPVGLKQRLALGCAIIHDPKIVFLDEPTSGVDPKARRQFWDMIYQIADQGKTVFVTTHFMDEAEYCHRVSIMQDGKVIALDTPVSLKKEFGKSTMQDVFITLLRTNRLGAL